MAEKFYNSKMINIITRTHNRPKFFKRCVESITQQNVKNINHIVTYQTNEDYQYIKNFQYKNTTLVHVPSLIKQDKTLILEGNNLKHAPYNLYLNKAHKFINKGWVMYLDDDDQFTYKNSLEILIQEVKQFDTDTKHLWRVKFPNYLIPDNERFERYSKNKPLEICQISMIGMCFNSKHLDKINFHEWGCGDYFAFSNLDKQLPKRNMINLPLTGLQTTPGWGNSNDLK